MNGYNLSEWLEGFEKDGREFDFATDALISNTNVLLPGRFYILNYMAETDKTYNARPIIISLGLSKKDPESFLCVDLCLIPRIARIKFVQSYFNMFEKQIMDNMNNFWNVEDADKQKQIKQFSYELLNKMPMFKPLKYAVKKYKIKNTFKIYSIPFSGVYKIIGKLPDKNFIVNGNIKFEQEEFLKNNTKR